MADDLWKRFERFILTEVKAPELELEKLQKKPYQEIEREGSRFRFCGEWTIIDMVGGVAGLISNERFVILKKGSKWEEQAKRLKEQGFREVMSCPS